MLCSDKTGTLTQDVIDPVLFMQKVQIMKRVSLRSHALSGYMSISFQSIASLALHARVHEVDRGQYRRQSGRFGDTFRLGRCEPGSVLATTHWWGCCTVGTLRRYHGLWEGICLAHGCRSVPLGTLCGTMRWVFVVGRGQYRSGSGRFGDTIRLGRCVPRGWVGHFALVKCYLFGGRIRCSADWLSDNSWSEQVGGGSGADLDGWGPTRAQVSVIVGVR